MAEQNNLIESEKVVLEGRNKLTMTGVSAVDGFSSQYLKLTASGSRVLVTGENIKITSFNKGTGTLVAEGLICELKYNEKKEKFIKRLFK